MYDSEERANTSIKSLRVYANLAMIPWCQRTSIVGRRGRTDRKAIDRGSDADDLQACISEGVKCDRVEAQLAALLPKYGPNGCCCCCLFNA